VGLSKSDLVSKTKNSLELDDKESYPKRATTFHREKDKVCSMGIIRIGTKEGVKELHLLVD
jgi:hypothetical protein